MLPILPLAIAGAVGSLGYCYWRGACARHTKREIKEDIRRWEDEGGNVPSVATPSPAPVPQTSFPAAEGPVH